MLVILLPENYILTSKAQARDPYLSPNRFVNLQHFGSGSDTSESNLVIRNVHRCISKGAEKSAFYVCLFLPNVEVIYCSKANEYQLMRCSQPYCLLEQLNSCDWRLGCISPQGKMMRKECLHNTLRLSMMDSTS